MAHGPWPSTYCPFGSPLAWQVPRAVERGVSNVERGALEDLQSSSSILSQPESPSPVSSVSSVSCLALFVVSRIKSKLQPRVLVLVSGRLFSSPQLLSRHRHRHRHRPSQSSVLHPSTVYRRRRRLRQSLTDLRCPRAYPIPTLHLNLISSHTTRNSRFHTPPPSTYFPSSRPFSGFLSLISDPSFLSAAATLLRFPSPAFLASIVSLVLLAGHGSPPATCKRVCKRVETPNRSRGGRPICRFRQVRVDKFPIPFSVPVPPANSGSVSVPRPSPPWTTPSKPSSCFHFRRRVCRPPPAFGPRTRCVTRPQLAQAHSTAPPVCPGPATGETRHATRTPQDPQDPQKPQARPCVNADADALTVPVTVTAQTTPLAGETTRNRKFRSLTALITCPFTSCCNRLSDPKKNRQSHACSIARLPPHSHTTTATTTNSKQEAPPAFPPKEKGKGTPHQSFWQEAGLSQETAGRRTQGRL
ncbi:hypothetical protein EDB80DRAFT_811142 [Ilyonectria destructans]|nr:hypothetical protein EDB80DRAFT_811142 [Ilyonectria destructans]